MKITVITWLALSLFSHAANASTQEREYNTWYKKDAVLYGMTQTSSGMPVMVSFSQPGQKNANLVVSLMSSGECDENSTLTVNGQIVPAAYGCEAVGTGKVEHFTVLDSIKVNGMVDHLNADFTLLLQGDIKVWAANVKSPRFGISPNF